MQNNVDANLNPAQAQGVNTLDGPVLVIAGAGSGKTKMLTSRIVNLMGNHRVSGHHILAVTFTNKAAEEMRTRVSRALGLAPDALTPSPFVSNFSANAMFSQPMIGTFHSICVRILRREIEHTPFTKQFVIYDDSDQLTLVKDCFSKLNISDKSFSPKSFQWAINSAKCSALEPHELEAESYDLFAKNLAKVYALYQQELFRNNALDFGEIITMTYRIFRDKPEILEKYQRLYQYIHVDEYQDTNRAQYLLIKLLAAGTRNICVVGDEDQSIYKWRGADIKNILDFEKDYPEAKVIKLEQNYRSTQMIINASSELISNNAARKSKRLWTDNAVGDKILRFQVSDERAEAELVVGTIKQACEREGFSYNDVAIFYRTNAQSRIFEDVLRRERLPYKVVGGVRFYDRKEIKDVLSYFRTLVNPEDSVSFRRIINVPARGIGKTTVDKIEELATEKNVTFEMGLRMAVSSNVFGAAARKKLVEFLSLMDELRALLETKNLTEFYHELMDRSKYVHELKAENTEEATARIENLQELNSIMIEFGYDDKKAAETLPVFLENVTLVGEQAGEPGEAEISTGNINMMTFHTSKGLEYPLVFMVGMEEGLFPSIRAGTEENDEDIEEERRLCYVGMTRAEKKLVMTHAVCRRIYGNILYNEPARFFNEIPESFIDYKDLAGFRTSYGGWDRRDENQDVGYGSRPMSSGFSTTSVMGSGSSSSNSKVGKRVRHSVYGEGIIKSIEGSSGNEADVKVTVAFKAGTTKKFILKFANLEYLN